MTRTALIIRSHVQPDRRVAPFGPHYAWDYFDADDMAEPFEEWSSGPAGEYGGPDTEIYIVAAPLCEPGTPATDPDPAEERLCARHQR